MRYSDKWKINQVDDEHIEIKSNPLSILIKVESIDFLRLKATSAFEEHYPAYWTVGVGNLGQFDFSQKNIAESFYNEIRKYYPVKSNKGFSKEFLEANISLGELDAAGRKACKEIFNENRKHYPVKSEDNRPIGDCDICKKNVYETQSWSYLDRECYVHAHDDCLARRIKEEAMSK